MWAVPSPWWWQSKKEKEVSLSLVWYHYRLITPPPVSLSNPPSRKTFRYVFTGIALMSLLRHSEKNWPTHVESHTLSIGQIKLTSKHRKENDHCIANVVRKNTGWAAIRLALSVNSFQSRYINASLLRCELDVMITETHAPAHELQWSNFCLPSGKVL